MNRDFKGVWIPKNIWVDAELSWMEKLFIVEIDSLDNENHCFASNSYFAEFFQLSKPRCTQIIKSLEAKGFLSIKLEWKGKAVTKRTITVNKAKYNGSKNIKQGGKDSKQGGKDSKQGVVRKLNDSNTESNNTINNFLQTEKIETPQTEKHESDYVDFNNLNGTQKPKLLGQIKGLLQKEFNMFTFDKNDTFKINQAIYKVKDNLTAYNKSNGIFISVLDENVLEAFKTSMVIFKGKFKDSTNWSIPLFASCLNVNDYIKIDDTAKLLSLASDEIKEKYYKIAARDGKEIANEILRKVLKQHKI
jgi:hypothetical protein